MRANITRILSGWVRCEITVDFNHKAVCTREQKKAKHMHLEKHTVIKSIGWLMCSTYKVRHNKAIPLQDPES